jgi:hypothetical protein
MLNFPMVSFTAVIKKFQENGDKTGWTYIEIPSDIAEHINPGVKKSFKVKGSIDNIPVARLSLLPAGEGSFILALNASLRKKIRKIVGEKVKAEFETDLSEKPFDQDFIECLQDAPDALEFYNTLPRSHQRYFSDWIASAKTESTKTRRIVQSIEALGHGLGYSQMIRMNKKNE